ncbi:hypothetical protein C8R44DRAFT_237598 [Mycena epipterygia]|nr:hypothetical protein C8R44DRAFT_237598 [Mycena epipterygia]
MDPALILPQETLTEIFHLCDSSRGGHGVYSHELVTRRSPWLLSHVSHHWRVVALSTPRLWRLLSVKISPHGNESVLQLITLFLERSACCPISIAVAFLGEDVPQNCPILERLMSVSDRWEEVSIFAPSAFIQHLSPIRGHLHRLSHLEFTREDEWDDILPEITDDTFANAPRLHSVVLMSDPPVSIVLPWNQLTEYKTTYSELVPILQVLRELVNLVTLTLDQLQSFDIATPLSTVRLPRLFSLSLTADNGLSDHPGELLDHLHLPALACLSVECYDTNIYPHITALISRSGCTLDTFTLDIYETILDVSLIPILAAMPQLTRLSLCGSRVSDDLLAQLTGPESALVPLMASLSLRATFSQESLFQLVTSRFPGGALKQVHLSLEVADMESVIVYGILPLTEMGLEAHLLR